MNTLQLLPSFGTKEVPSSKDLGIVTESFAGCKPNIDEIAFSPSEERVLRVWISEARMFLKTGKLANQLALPEYHVYKTDTVQIPHFTKKQGKVKLAYFQLATKQVDHEYSRSLHKWIDGRLFLRIDQEYLAKTLGISVITVKRALKKFLDIGIFEKRKVWGLKMDHTKFFSLKTELFDGLFRRKKYLSTDFAHKFVDKFMNYEDHDMNRKDNSLKGITRYIKSREKSQISFSKKIQRDDVATGVSSCVISANATSVSPGRGQPTVREMFEVVRDLLGNKLPDLRLNKKVSAMLGALRNQFFKTKETWQEFVKAVKESWFFMREDFKMSLDWLLSFRIVRRILFCGMGISKTIRKAHCEYWQKKLNEAKEDREIYDVLWACDNIEAKDESEELKGIRKEIVRKFGVAKYRAYFANATMEKRGSVVYIRHSLGILGALSEMFSEAFAKHGYVIEEIANELAR